MRTLGVILILLGLIGFIVGGFSFTQTEQVADVGPVEVQAEQQERVSITPWASGAAVVAGIALVGAAAYRQSR